MAYNSTPPSIIIADDFPMFRQGVINSIKTRNHFAITAEADSGIKVIELLESNKFDIVLIGNHISPLNGLETANVVKQKFLKTKIIGLESYPNATYIIELFEMGADGFLLKNVSNEELQMAIGKVLKGEKHFPDYLLNGILKKENGIIKHIISDKKHIRQRLQQVIYLICHGMSTMKISKELGVSNHTIDHDRLAINKLIGSNHIAGVIKFGFETGILTDESLINRFEKDSREVNKIIYDNDFI